jgi:ubiquinone/menaquinone biosynthesis C-methylase UbiE
MSSSATPEFAARVAARYDELRASEDYGRLVARLVAAGDLAGRRVLDIGCGTGTLAGELAARYECDVCGVDASPEMLSVAREKYLPRVELALARAEGLPYAERTFERAVMLSVVHHLDRRRAFAEAYRVLLPDGRLVISNADPDGFADRWLLQLFPELLDRELARFPTAHDLEAELGGSGFGPIDVTRVSVPRRYSRDVALEKLRGRHISSFDLLTEDEYARGVARAEQELPDPVEYTFRSLLVVAVRPPR